MQIRIQEDNEDKLLRMSAELDLSPTQIVNKVLKMVQIIEDLKIHQDDLLKTYNKKNENVKSHLVDKK